MNDATGSGPAPAADAGLPLALLASLVVKEGVALGGLPATHRSAALGLAWTALPQGVGLSEAQVNTALKRCLVDECGFLATDHVELRRWLVDAGWLARDGFGRAYHRIEAVELAPENALVATALARIDPQRWVCEVRADYTARREARRQAWEARQAKGPGQAGQGGA